MILGHLPDTLNVAIGPTENFLRRLEADGVLFKSAYFALSELSEA